jgi:hypothetical protein
MADDGHGEWIDGHVDLLQRLDGQNDVLMTFGPPATRTQAAVFNVPHGVSVLHQIGGDVVLQIASIPFLPAPTVDKDDHVRCAVGGRQPEVRDLFSMVAV